jgi:tetratricopeptide (TPR) repeat protein
MQYRDKLENMAVVAPSRPTALRSEWALAVLSAFLFTPALLRAQTAPAAPDAPTAQKPPEKKPSAAEQFPYPDESNPPTNAAPQPDAPTPSTPTAPPTPNTTKQFPYPGDSPAPNPGSSSSSSSSSSADSDADPDSTPDSDNPPAKPAPKQTGRRKLAKPQNLQTDDEREAEDLTVARFYRDKGDLNAAYLRSKDAVKHLPDDPDAHFLLAEIAQKLNKRDEAIAEYKTTLKLDASDKQIKSANKALAQLQ